MIELRFFGGLTIQEIAEALDISPATVTRDWVTAKAWLFDRLNPAADNAPAERTMTLNDGMKSGTVLYAASRLEGGARSRYLDETCAADTALREEVERLLAALDESGGFPRAGCPGNVTGWPSH